MSALVSLDEWEARHAGATSPVIEAVLRHLPPGGTFVDIGANVGLVSRAAADHGAWVIAFEPVSEYRARCREVLGDRGSVVALALGDAVERRTLWCDDTNLGWNTFVTEKADHTMHGIEVVVGVFDDYAEEVGLGRLDVVKIDVEGYEHAVLRGMHRSLERFHPVLCLELGWGTSHPQRAAEVVEMEWLFAHGYERIDYAFDGTRDVVVVPA